MKNEQWIYKNESGSFCSQLGFSQKETKPLSKQHKKKQVGRKPSKENFYHNKRGTHGKYRMNETKKSRHIQRMMNKEAQKILETFLQYKTVCFKYGKIGHYKKDCKLRKKINNFNITKDLKDMFYEVMLNSSESESMTNSDNVDDINQLEK